MVRAAPALPALGSPHVPLPEVRRTRALRADGPAPPGQTCSPARYTSSDMEHSSETPEALGVDYPCSVLSAVTIATVTAGGRDPSRSRGSRGEASRTQPRRWTRGPRVTPQHGTGHRAGRGHGHRIPPGSQERPSRAAGGRPREGPPCSTPGAPTPRVLPFCPSMSHFRTRRASHLPPAGPG